MLSREQRIAIFELAGKGLGKKAIARTLGVSRSTVRSVLASGHSRPPKPERSFKAEPYREEILALYASCQGNLWRVHEELLAQGVEISYPALTGFCRRAGIGTKPKRAAGRYVFGPGKELQHDTSPHTAILGDKRRGVQSAAGTLAYSGMLFFAGYPRFRRLECKSFLTDTWRYLEGVTQRVLIDNTHVVVLRGTGATMVPVPEMVAFAQRLGFRFQAHEKGDANRSAVVERTFSFIEGNFYAGRRFADFTDLNAQAREWCDRVNQRFVRSRRARPIELFAAERIALRPLPAWLPDPYELLHRTVDMEGYVCLDTNRYSVPEEWIGDLVEIRATVAAVTIDHRRDGTVEHSRLALPEKRRVTLPEHRHRPAKRPAPTERELHEIQSRAPELLDYARALLKRGKRQPTLALRQLLRLLREYPREPLVAAVAEAHHYGLFDLDRLETMILRRIAGEIFRLGGDEP